MSYASKDIRNIALLGHGGNGKTSLAESILFLTGATDRLGSSAVLLMVPQNRTLRLC